MFYIKMGIPRVPGLPVFGYGGTATSTKGKHTGAKKRCSLGHAVDMERGLM